MDGKHGGQKILQPEVPSNERQTDILTCGPTSQPRGSYPVCGFVCRAMDGWWQLHEQVRRVGGWIMRCYDKGPVRVFRGSLIEIW